MFFYHVFLLTLSNILVQYPFELFGFHTTWGAFTYPAIFILTDLTTRLFSAEQARKVIFQGMFPALIISYVLASFMEAPKTDAWFDILGSIHIMPLRIAIACFVAYVVGQLLDVSVFQRYRAKSSWWVAPVISISIGNIVDTILFFSIAFYHCNNLFLSQNWIEIACVDIVFKIVISLIAFVPLYGVILNRIGLQFVKKVVTH